MISVKNLRKSFGSNVAVNDLSLDISPGETLGLLGPNGAGKSTTINMMVGLLTPDGGAVAIRNGGGKDLDPLQPAARNLIGVAPQSLSLYDELSARENLNFFGSLYALRGSDLSSRVKWALEFAALRDRANDRVKTYSGGMKRRLNIAVALIHKPQILLLDEPTVGVDPQSRNHIFDIIAGLQKEGMTIIYTTHYMEEASRLCDRVAVIDHGRLLDIGPVSALIERHGGESVVTATLSNPAAGVSLPGTVDGQELRFESANPIDDVARLKSEGVGFQSLHISQPDLESVFLTLTGRSLRDE
ncbi:MAG: ABC transporter ATP-binding protein [Planctomycetota bacterium]